MNVQVRYGESQHRFISPWENRDDSRTKRAKYGQTWNKITPRLDLPESWRVPRDDATLGIHLNPPPFCVTSRIHARDSVMKFYHSPFRVQRAVYGFFFFLFQIVYVLRARRGFDAGKRINRNAKVWWGFVENDNIVDERTANVFESYRVEYFAPGETRWKFRGGKLFSTTRRTSRILCAYTVCALLTTVILRKRNNIQYRVTRLSRGRKQFSTKGADGVFWWAVSTTVSS